MRAFLTLFDLYVMFVLAGLEVGRWDGQGRVGPGEGHSSNNDGTRSSVLGQARDSSSDPESSKVFTNESDSHKVARKVDLNAHGSYEELSLALEGMFVDLNVHGSYEELSLALEGMFTVLSATSKPQSILTCTQTRSHGTNSSFFGREREQVKNGSL